MLAEWVSFLVSGFMLGVVIQLVALLARRGQP